MSREDGFLARWSRRKLGGDRAGDGQEVPTEVPASEAGPAPHAGEDAISEEEIALLPPIEELTPESDFSGFLRRGVPDALRKAALRRMWALDPAIRDYVGDARDYAWDWNVEGGVPGNGLLGIADDFTEQLGRLFSTVGDDAAEQATARPADAPEAAAGEGEEPAVAEEAPVAIPAAASSAAADPLPVSRPVALQPKDEPVDGAAARELPLRRHGAALPKFDLF